MSNTKRAWSIIGCRTGLAVVLQQYWLSAGKGSFRSHRMKAYLNDLVVGHQNAQATTSDVNSKTISLA
jgi:hypothetical protein